MAKRILKQLPLVQLTPTTRGQGSFSAVDATSDHEGLDGVLISFYCHGMDVQIDLSKDQAKRALEVLQAALNGER